MTLKHTQQRPSPLPPQGPRGTPMRSLDLKEMRQVAGGPFGYPDMGPKKP
jgi:hypothetical protein